MTTAGHFRALIDSALAAGNTNGHELKYETRSEGGFPYAVIFHLSNLRWHDNAGAHAQAADVTLSAYPWQWNAFNVEFRQGAEATVPFPPVNDILTVRSDSGKGHIVMNEAGWRLMRLRLKGAQVRDPKQDLFTADELALSAQRPDHAPKDHTEVGLRLSGEARDVSLKMKTEKPLPFGNTIDTFNLALRVMGMPPDPANRESVTAWNTESGVVTCDTIDLTWGPLTLALTGALGLDDELQPEAAFTGPLGNHTDVIKSLLEGGWIKERQAMILEYAFNQFSKPLKLTGAPSVFAPVNVQLGGVYLGPVLIFSLPRLVWKAPKVGQDDNRLGLRNIQPSADASPDFSLAK